MTDPKSSKRLHTAHSLLVIVVLVLVEKFVEANGKLEYDLNIRMPSVVSNKPDSLICTGVQLPTEESYIVKFTPHASKATAHHMMVYGCIAPANRESSWICNQGDGAVSEHSVCANGEERQILFAWALDAPAKSLPEGIGLRIGGATTIKYIVIQLHYANAFEGGETDSSGMTLRITQNRPSMQMGYYVLLTTGKIEPQQEEAHSETACIYQDEYPIYPIGYRTHSHNLGVVTTGYRIRDGIWTEIGRMSPQLPETFYNITNPGMDIRRGDILAARCTMNSMTRTMATYMGPTNHDEMCNFYIMYSTHKQENLKTEMCFPPSPDYAWKDGIVSLPPPSNVSSLDGIRNADYVRQKFNMTSNSV